MPNSIKSLGYIKCYRSSSLSPVKNLAVLSDTTFRRFTVDQEDLKPYWKSEKRSHFSRWSIILSFASFSKTLLTTERTLTGYKFSAVDLSQRFLNTGTTHETFQQSGKEDTFRHKWRVQLVCKKAQAHSSLELKLKYNQGQTLNQNEFIQECLLINLDHKFKSFTFRTVSFGTLSLLAK